MMGKLPLGVVSPYVKMSSGGCTDPLKFYATSYCTAYGREDFQPRMGSHRGTGYESNLRPLVTSLDNAASREKYLDDGFQTLHRQNYRPLEVPDGKAPLPRGLHQTLSGFSRENIRSTAPLKESRDTSTPPHTARSMTSPVPPPPRPRNPPYGGLPGGHLHLCHHLPHRHFHRHYNPHPCHHHQHRGRHVFIPPICSQRLVPEGDRREREEGRGRRRKEEKAEKEPVVETPDKDAKGLSDPLDVAGQGGAPGPADSMCKGPEAAECGVKRDSSKEVRKVHFDTQDYGAQNITGLEPKEVPLLHQQQGKGSLEWENSRHGPRSMVSEYNSKYKEPLSQPDLLQKKSIGPKEESGFTEESTKNPIVFLPPSQALPEDPVLVPNRSVTKSDFVPVNYPRGNEFLPVLARGTERESGFSRPSERNINPRVPAPAPEACTTSLRQFQSPQRMQQTNLALLGRESMGNKEPSGYTLNTPSYVRSTQDPTMDNHYLTTYNQGYFENTPKGLDREGWTRGGIQPQKPGGYALNQPVTRLEGVPNPEESLKRLHPHVGRTLIATDPFYRTPPHSNHFTAPN